jgi:outer membrane lipoprotein SlyB
VSGAALGHPVPGGDGNAFAQVGSTLGHAGPGTANIIYASPQPGQLVSVKLDNGVAVAITQPVDPRLRVGERVRIVGAGPGARVTP